MPLVVNVMGFTREEVARLVATFAERDEVAALELNVSCPNVESGCISIGSDAAETRALLERCRAETDRPLLAKLSPSVKSPAICAVPPLMIRLPLVERPTRASVLLSLTASEPLSSVRLPP